MRKWVKNRSSPGELPGQWEQDQYFVASDEFIETYMQIRKSSGSSGRTGSDPGVPGEEFEGVNFFFGPTKQEVCRPSKKRGLNRIRAGLADAARRYGYRITAEIAGKLNVSDTTVSRMIKKVTGRDTELQDQWDQ